MCMRKNREYNQHGSQQAGVSPARANLNPTACFSDQHFSQYTNAVKQWLRPLCIIHA